MVDLFEHRYYRLGKKFMTLIGQWPYHSTRARRGFLVVSIFLVTTGLVPLVLAYGKYHDDRRIVLESVILYLTGIGCVIKFISIIWNSEKTLMLLNRTCTNWQVWARHREVNILHKYAEQGEKIIIVYTAVIYSTIVIFVAQPIIQNIVDVILKNSTEPLKFPYPVDYYFFDEQKYYCYVMMHLYICACVVAIPVVASDSMLIIYVQHVCAVFAALRHKSKQIGNNDTSVENVVSLSSFIQKHNDSIEYANLIEATYTWSFFFLIGPSIILINLFGLQILIGMNNPESLVRLMVSVLTLGLIFYVYCYICEMLTDHSVNVGSSIYNSQWYRLLPSDRKLLQLIILRCRVPCQITAGKMWAISVKNLGLIFRTIMSYFVVIQSMHKKLNIA